MRHLIAAGAILCALSLPAGAQEAGRFTMTPTANGVIRLDTRTGALSTCVSGAEGLVCRAATAGACSPGVDASRWAAKAAFRA